MENVKSGQKFFVEIEGTEYPWDKETITIPEIRNLGHLPADQPVIEIDPDNNEITLREDAVIELKPGHRFGKKPKFKRGWTDRVQGELELLRKFFSDVEYIEQNQIIIIPKYKLPDGIWHINEARIAFMIPSGYPGQKPYAFYASPELKLKGNEAQKVTNCEPCQLPPLDGIWGKFSWDAESWQPTSDLSSGSNLLNFAMSFKDRLREAN